MILNFFRHHASIPALAIGLAPLGAENGEAGDVPADAATLLSMARGHLLVSLELYRAGERSLTGDHAQHPEHESFPAFDRALSELGQSDPFERIEDCEHTVMDGRPLAGIVEGEADLLHGAAARIELIAGTF